MLGFFSDVSAAVRHVMLSLRIRLSCQFSDSHKVLVMLAVIDIVPANCLFHFIRFGC